MDISEKPLAVISYYEDMILARNNNITRKGSKSGKHIPNTRKNIHWQYGC